jgi:hypothetical protein
MTVRFGAGDRNLLLLSRSLTKNPNVHVKTVNIAMTEVHQENELVQNVQAITTPAATATNAATPLRTAFMLPPVLPLVEPEGLGAEEVPLELLLPLEDGVKPPEAEGVAEGSGYEEPRDFSSNG